MTHDTRHSHNAVALCILHMHEIGCADSQKCCVLAPTARAEILDRLSVLIGRQVKNLTNSFAAITETDGNWGEH